MSEVNIQSGLQAAIQAMDEFADADVVINDWGILDQSSSLAPYVLIENADDFTSDQDTLTPNNVWHIPVTLIERFVDWDTTLNNLRTRRQAILDKINAVGTTRTAGGIAGTNVRRVRNDGPIQHVYDRYLSEAEQREALPSFIMQRLILETEEF